MAESAQEKKTLRRSESRGPTTRGGKGCSDKRIRYGPESPAEASGKRPRIGLSEDDRPTPKLLNRIAGHVIYGHLQSIANELELPEGRASQAMGDSAGAKPKTQIFKILSIWENSTLTLTIQMLIDKLKDWVRRGFVDSQVWQDIQDLVDFDVPASTHAPIKISAEATPGTALLSTTRLKKIQTWTKESFRQPPFSLVNYVDWTSPPTKSARLKDVYTKPSYRQIHRTMQGTEHENLNNVTDILDRDEFGCESPVRILLQGRNGSGKTTVLKYVARSWADGSDDQLDQFDFVFHVTLQGAIVEKDANLENIIISQHSGLKVNGVRPEEIRSILHEQPMGKVFLLVDGLDYDGMNNDIDKAVQKMSLWKCYMMITSRNSRDVLSQYMDVELELCGIDETNVKEYMKKFCPNEQRVDEILKEGKDIFLSMKDNDDPCEQFSTPVYLNMIGTLLLKRANKASMRASTLQVILDRILDREAVRNRRDTTSNEAKETIVLLGKLAWEGLNHPDGIKQTFSKAVLRELGAETLMHVLLQVVRDTEEDEVEVYSFNDLWLQQFLAAKYLASVVSDGKSWIAELFHSIPQMKKHQEVLKLTCGLMTRPEELIEQVCDALSRYIDKVEVSGDIDNRLLTCCCFLKSLCKELPQLPATDTSNCRTVAFFARNASFVFFPQRFDECFVALLHAPAMYNEIECAVIVNSACGFNPAGLDKVREKFVINAKIAISSLLVVTDAHVDPESVHVGKLLNSLRVFKAPKIFVMQDCYIPLSVSSLITQQLPSCNEMQFVCLLGVRNLPEFLCTALIKCSTDVLKSIQMEQSELVKGDWNKFVYELTRRYHLEYLSFARTKHLPPAFARAVPIVHELDFTDCCLSKVAENIWCDSSRFTVLSLAGNSLKNGLSYQYSSISSLKSLSLNETQLTQKDIRLIGICLRETHCQLRRLFVSLNTLTDCVVDLIPTDKTLADLEVLWMRGTSLSRQDIKHLGRVVVSGSLPRLFSLDLSENDLFTKEGDLENLILACTAQYRMQGMNIHLEDNYLSKEFEARVESICHQTNVVPSLEGPALKPWLHLQRQTAAEHFRIPLGYTF